MVQFGHQLKETVLYPVPHRQYVFSIPKILRKFFLYDRKLLGKLSQCAARSLSSFFRISLGKNYGIPGIVIAIQTFGDYVRWHPHLHALVADGLFLESGYFLSCRGDGRGLENLAHYIIRNAFSLEKLNYYEKTDRVVYHSKMTHGKNKKNFELFSPLECIAAITQHILEQSFQLVRYYGWYSNRMRGDRKKQQEPDKEDCSEQGSDDKIIEIRSYRAKCIPQLLWRA